MTPHSVLFRYLDGLPVSDEEVKILVDYAKEKFNNKPCVLYRWSSKNPYDDHMMNSFSSCAKMARSVGSYFQKTDNGHTYEVEAVPVLSIDNIRFMIHKFCDYEPYRKILLRILKQEGEYLVLNSDIISMRII